MQLIAAVTPKGGILERGAREVEGEESDRDDDGEACGELHELGDEREHPALGVSFCHRDKSSTKTKTAPKGGFCFARPIS